MDERFDDDEWDDTPIVSDEYITLRDLGPLVRREGPLAPRRAVGIVLRIAHTLAEAMAGDAMMDEREQVYWLGAALFFALTGRSPFRAGSRRPSLLSPYRVPAMLDNIVRVCLARHDARFATTIELQVVLGAVTFMDDDADTGPSSAVRAYATDRPTSPPGPMAELDPLSE